MGPIGRGASAQSPYPGLRSAIEGAAAQLAATGEVPSTAHGIGYAVESGAKFRALGSERRTGGILSSYKVTLHADKIDKRLGGGACYDPEVVKEILRHEFDHIARNVANQTDDSNGGDCEEMKAKADELPMLCARIADLVTPYVFPGVRAPPLWPV